MGIHPGNKAGSVDVDTFLARISAAGRAGLLTPEDVPVEEDDSEVEVSPPEFPPPPYDPARTQHLLVVELDLSMLLPPKREEVLVRLMNLLPDGSDLDVPAPWFCWQVGSGYPQIQDFRGDRVLAVMQVLMSLHLGQPNLGAVVVLAPGSLRALGVRGEAALRLEAAEERLMPEKLLRFGDFGPISAPEDIWWRAARPLLCVGLEIQAQEHAGWPGIVNVSGDKNPRPVFHNISHYLQISQELVRDSRHVSRDLSSPQTGDNVRLRFKSPPWATIYLLRERSGRLDLPRGAVPLVEEGKPGEMDVLYPLEEGAVQEKPVLLVANQPIPELLSLLSEHPGMDPLGDLVAKLHRVPDLQFGLAPFDMIDHQLPAASTRHPDWVGINKALAEDNLPLALDLVDDLLGSGDELGEDESIDAYWTKGKCLRKIDPDLAQHYLATALELALGRQDHQRQGIVHRELAQLHFETNNRAEAWRHLERAQQLHGGGDLLEVLRDELTRAGMSLNVGQWDDALIQYQRVAGAWREGDPPRLKAAALHGIGVAQVELGHFREASQSLSQALKLCESIQHESGAFRVLGNLGTLSVAEGRRSAAIDYFRRQVELSPRQVPRDQLIAKLGLVQALMEKGDFDAAEGILKPLLAAPRPDEIRNRVALLWLDGEMRLQRADVAGVTTLLPELQAHLEIPLDLSWRLLTLGARIRAFLRYPETSQHFERAVSFLEEHRARLPVDLRTRYFEVRQSLFQSWILCLLEEGASSEVLLGVVERIRARTLLEHLRNSVPTQSTAPSAPYAEVLPRLGADPNLKDAAFLVWQVLDTSILALAVYQGKVFHHVIPWAPPRRQLQLSLVEAWLSRPASSPVVWSEFSALVLGPFKGWLEELPDDTLLGLAPHGHLAGLPLHAAEDPAHPGRPLLARLVPFMVPSLATALELAARPVNAAATGSLVLADPPGAGLQYAQMEAAQVLEELPGELCTGPRANLDALRRHGGEVAVIHVVTHARRIRRETAGALLLANPEGTGSVEVGVDDLLGLGLSGQLVVVSACEAAGGQSTWFGEGPDLLTWALLAAGARCVVSSLWRVSDKATPELMRDFYHALVRGGGPARALAHAQRQRMSYRDGVIDKHNTQSQVVGVRWSSISDWAAFVALGEGGSAAI